MMTKLLKKISSQSLLPEIFFLSFVVIAFDFIFLKRFNFAMPFNYWMIAIFNVAFFVSILTMIKSNKNRFRAHLIYFFSMFVLFVSNSTLYYFKNDISSVATLMEMFKASMQIGLKYNPFTAYELLTWLGIIGFTFLSIYILKTVVYFHDDQKHRKPSRLKYVLLVASLVYFVSPMLIKDEDLNAYETPQDKALFIQKFGSLTFYARDIVVYATTMIEPLFIAEELKEDLDEKIIPSIANQSPYFGLLEDDNVIMIMCETCEEYAFDPDLTPNYYRLYNQSMVYDNTFTAAKHNYTYDAEFKALTSMMYSGLDNYMYTYGENSYKNALPWVLRAHGYTANSFHNYHASFFNRDVVHPNLGFERYYALEDLEVSPTDYWPLDSWLFEQMIEKMVPQQTDPFFSFIITVTPHGPHDHYREELAKYYDDIEAHGKYSEYEQEFKTILAAQMNFDEGLGLLLDYLEETELLENTTIVFFSDHKNYSSTEITEKYTEDSDIPYEIEKIPFMIYSSKLSHGHSDIYTSHYDVTPTLFDLLGISYYQEFYYGQSLFDPNREDLPIILTHSRWILPNYAVTDDQIVIGDISQSEFDAMKLQILDSFERFESMFKANYFQDRETYIIIE